MNKKVLVAIAIEETISSVLYLKFVRPWVLNWGARQGEVEMTLPGDDILPDAGLQTTRVVTVDAPPDAIWPWLVQMGPRPRAGAYTYDWIERLLGIDIENSDRILPEFQHIEPGEFMGLNQKGDGIRLVSVEPERSLVLQWVPQTSTWTFALERESEGTTRLISRNRLPDVSTWFGLPGSKLLSKLFMLLFMEPGSLVMERKMLFGIKERAERLHDQEHKDVAEGISPFHEVETQAPIGSESVGG